MNDEYTKKLEEIIEKQYKIIEEYEEIIKSLRGLFQGGEPLQTNTLTEHN